ncbi:hypothetical protein Tco_0511133 [Tanacetum coccineum]
MSEPMPTIPTQSPFTYPIPNSSASPSFTQDDTFMPNPSASPSFTQDDTFMPEPIQPMPTFTQTAFSQPFSTQHTHPAQTNPTGQQYPNNVQSQQFQQFQTATISANNAKFPYLEKEKYEIWAMKMEYWIQNADHNLEVLFIKGTQAQRVGKRCKRKYIVSSSLLLLDETSCCTKGKISQGNVGGNEESKKMKKTMLNSKSLELDGQNCHVLWCESCCYAPKTSFQHSLELLVQAQSLLIPDQHVDQLRWKDGLKVANGYAPFEDYQAREVNTDEPKALSIRCFPVVNVQSSSRKPLVQLLSFNDGNSPQAYQHALKLKSHKKDSDPAMPFRNRPAVNPADRPHPAGGLKDQQLFLLVDQFLLVGLILLLEPFFQNQHCTLERNTRPQFCWGSKSNCGISQSPREITSTDNDIGKVTIKRTSKLDFENVYYVEELQHFNLFSVSQICDKKNKVLFTDTDCLVLSEEFQLPDASQLAKEGLVDGLPLKVFTNEHNCVACNKGKQHKASYKHISAVRLITDTLQLLHMDLFGPTNIRSIDHSWTLNCLSLWSKLKKKRMSTQPKDLKILTFPKACIQSGLKHCMDFIMHLDTGMQDCLPFCYNTTTEEVLIEQDNSSSRKILQGYNFGTGYVDDIIYWTTVKQLPDGLFISQDKYVKDMLTKFDMESVRTATTPYEAAKTKLKDETDPPVNVHLYRKISACSRHQVTPLTSHLNAVKKIFKYLKGQPKLGLWYPKDSPFQLEAYSDSDYAGSHGDRKSPLQWMSNFWAEEMPIEKNIIQVLKIHTDDNVQIYLKRHLDGQDLRIGGPYWDGESPFQKLREEYQPKGEAFTYCCLVCIPYSSDRLVSSLLLVGLGSAGKLSFLRQPLVSAGCTWFLLYLSSCCNPWFLLVLLWFLLIVIFPAGRLVSAGCTMVLLVVIFPAGRLVSAGCTMVLLVVICSCWTFELPAVYMVSLWLLFLLHKSLVFILLYIQSCWWKQCICIA